MFLVAACGGSSGAGLAVFNPDFFSGRVTDGTMMQAFNPQGFTASQVRALVAETCEGTVGGFATQRREDGLVNFSAGCAAWQSGAGAIEFERAGGSAVVVEITGLVGGNIIFDRIDTNIS